MVDLAGTYIPAAPAPAHHHLLVLLYLPVLARRLIMEMGFIFSCIVSFFFWFGLVFFSFRPAAGVTDLFDMREQEGRRIVVSLLSNCASCPG